MTMQECLINNLNYSKLLNTKKRCLIRLNLRTYFLNQVMVASFIQLEAQLTINSVFFVDEID